MDEEFQIVDVWKDNLEEAFEKIRDVLESYPYVSIDTEFPGIVAKPTSYLDDYNYQTVKCNVDLLKIIQLGLTFADSDGASAACSTWQFNFKFDLQHDMYAQDSIDLLKDSGIDFDLLQRQGIELVHFGELIMSSGLVMNEDVVWISFHGCYDFAYLLKVLTCASLPANQTEFFELLHEFFPSLYDIKFLLDERCVNLSGRLSLQRIAEHLEVKRIGPQHQAGSDSMVTSRTFFKLMQRYFENKLDDQKYQGIIYGLGKCTPSTNIGPINGTIHNASAFNVIVAGMGGATSASNSNASSTSGGGGVGVATCAGNGNGNGNKTIATPAITAIKAPPSPNLQRVFTRQFDLYESTTSASPPLASSMTGLLPDGLNNFGVGAAVSLGPAAGLGDVASGITLGGLGLSGGGLAAVVVGANLAAAAAAQGSNCNSSTSNVAATATATATANSNTSTGATATATATSAPSTLTALLPSGP